MSEFLTNTITIRGQSFVVQELDAKTMAEARRVIIEDKPRFEAFVAWKACIDPKFASEAEIAAKPQIFAEGICDEAIRLTKADPEKND